jgi:hypothetical protein
MLSLLPPLHATRSGTFSLNNGAIGRPLCAS